jgi:hypothetical protein
MKLELKYILAYLDSGLKAVDNKAEPDDNIINITGFLNTNGKIEFFDQHGNFDIELSDIKPILRPLSDLTKEIEVNGEKFVPNKRINDTFRKSSQDLVPYKYDGYNLELEIETENYSQRIDLYDGYLIMQKLFEWHFDVFGLIEKGLAIDFNETFTQK